MLIPLEEKWVQALSNKPESGMGYQQVAVKLSNGLSVTRLRVFNAEHLNWPDDRPPIKSSDIVDVRLDLSQRPNKSNTQ